MVEQFDKDYFYGKKKSNYSDYGRLIPSRQFKSVISFIRNRKLRGSFLDIGCAFGLLLKEVSPFFDEVSGCDISRYAIQKARRIIPKANLKIVNVDKSLPYVDESFDCIAALDILEHTSNFERNFEKIVSKLKKGGYLFVSVPIDSWPRKLFGFLDRDKTHVSILKEKRLAIISKLNPS